MGRKSVTRYILGAIFALLLPIMGHAQGGQLGSYSSPVVNGLGRPLPGISVAICQPLATTGAAVTSNVAVLTMASNPITAGFVAGMTIQVAGFTGGDTYYNGGTYTGTTITSGYTILSVTSTTITYSLVHANASAGTNGTVLQIGNSFNSCAGKSAVYSNPPLTTVTTNPIVTDGNGNWNVFAAPGLYYVQFYGTGINAILKQLAIACVPTGTCTTLSPLAIPGATSGSLALTSPAIAGSSALQLGVIGNGTGQVTFPAATDTVVELTQAQSLSNKTLPSPIINGTPTGTGIVTITRKKGTGSGSYSSASSSYVDVDATNLGYTITIPIGWKLSVAVGGEVAVLTAAVEIDVSLFDTSTILEQHLFPTATEATLSVPFNLNWEIDGDGASHTVKLQYKTTNIADSIKMENTSATRVPTMIFRLEPSN